MDRSSAAEKMDSRVDKLESEPLNGVFRRIKLAFDAALLFFGETTSLTLDSIRTLFTEGFDPADVLRQMASLGVDSIVIVLVVTVATGAVFAYYTAGLSLSVGYSGFVGGSLAYSFLNELGPVLGGVAFAARVGASIAAEIGSMVVTEQVEALRAMAVSPIRYLALPRILACILMLPLLIIIADAAGIWGGYYFAGLQGVAHVDFMNSIYTYVKPGDFINGLLKAIIFGFIVGIVACRQGLRTTQGATGVGRATTSSVVLCILLIFISDVFLSQLLTARFVQP